jgi:hypothetical protein
VLAVSKPQAEGYGGVIPGRASSREPGIQTAVRAGEAVWIPGSSRSDAPE